MPNVKEKSVTRHHSIVNNLVKRALFGAMYVATMVAAIIGNSPIVFACVFSVVLALGLREFYTLSSQIKGVKPQVPVSIIGGISAFLACSPSVNIGLWVFLPIWLILLITELFRKEEQPIHNLSFSFGGLMYVALPFCCMGQIMQLGNYYLLAFYIFVWVSDTGAYCIGKMFGKHKMSERISPKKTWEGIGGGLAFALIAGALAAHFITDANNPLSLNSALWMLYAVVSFVVGTLGDLVESLFKRYLGIKDSGSFLPGHGGVLDRFDSSLLGAPAALVLLEAVKALSEAV